jgi:mannitol-1-phosphate/altronate dehydrogenase
MPELTVAVQVSDVARAIKIMNKEEIETLTLLLTEEGAELLDRKKDFERNKEAFLSREDVFGV